MAYFPIQAEDNIKETFQYRREIREREMREAEQRQIEEYVGKQTPSIADEIVDELQQQRPEIEYVPLSEIATTREQVSTPPRIERLARDTFFNRLSRGLARFLRLKK